MNFQHILAFIHIAEVRACQGNEMVQGEVWFIAFLSHFLEMHLRPETLPPACLGLL